MLGSNFNLEVLTSALDEDECLASRTGRFIPRVKALVAPCLGGWLGPRAGLDLVAKREILIIAPSRDGFPVVQPVTELSRLLPIIIAGVFHIFLGVTRRILQYSF
jgi:hypothetical protein